MKLTPMMQQYRDTKEQYSDCLLMFRVGDFFELFYEDAVTAARELNIALTSRDKKEGEEGTPMAGVPHHALEAYLGRLIKKGYKVAICDQVEDPQLAKGLVRREVVRVVTPGTIIEDNLLEPSLNNWLMAVVEGEGTWGLAFIDISTAQFSCSQIQGSAEQVEAIISSLNPTEILTLGKIKAGVANTQVTIVKEEGAITKFYPDLPRDHFLSAYPLAARAAAMVLAYLEDRHRLPHIDIPGISWYDSGSFLFLDATSQRNLEILAPLDADSNGPSLLKVLDKTLTAMGGRMLKSMLIAPLSDLHLINQHLDCVEYFLKNYILRRKARELLRDIYDLERINSKVSYQNVNARDLLALSKSLGQVPALRELVQDMPSDTFRRLGNFEEVCSLIERGIHADPPVSLRDGNIIRPGFSLGLDEVRKLAASGNSWIRDYESALKEKTRIKSLKIGFNKVFGYYIEVTKSNLDQVPDWFIRKQTLVNCERFETRELKEWEDKILSAQERSQNMEYQLFCQIRDEVSRWVQQIQTTARAIASLDCWLALAEVAEHNNYCRPVMEDSNVLEICAGRHPVVEQFGTMEFVANDCLMDTETRQIMIITGPNMAGKSTFMRQVALIALLAHAGSFIPAESAKIGLLDAIYTRIGASDDLASGRSTFMVEMSELARILARATKRSLVLLDEIGRGTGTADGIGIARATLEYLHNSPNLAAKTLFATHYHQLTALSEQLPRLFNCSVQVSEKEGEVTFLHKIIPGGCDRSYGIHVAKLAGLPEQLVRAAEAYMLDQGADLSIYAACNEAASTRETDSAADEIFIALEGMELDEISPRKAWTILEQLISIASKRR